MKDKRLVYLLLGIAVLIWGTVIYRFFASLNDDGGSFVPRTQTRITKQEIEALKEDTFQLIANYPDPFFGKLVVQGVQNYGNNYSNISLVPKKKKVVPAAPKVEPPPPPPVVWPSVKFVGVIKNKITDKLVSILIVSGKEYMSGNTDYIDNIKINGIFRDSVQLEYQGIKRALLKGQQIP